MMTDQPAPVSTSAAVAPAGPLPITTASQSRGSVTPAHLVVGVAARLHVAFPTNRLPAREIVIAAVLRRTVRTFARVLVQHCSQVGLRVQATVLFERVDRGEVGAERGDTFPVDRLPTARRSVELACRDPSRAFDPRPPGQLLVRRQCDEALERRRASETTAER